MLVGALAVGGAAVAPRSRTIDRPATVAETADRVRPPGPNVGGCPVFPADNAWNQDISQAPLHPNSAAIIATIQSQRRRPACTPTSARTPTTASRSSSCRQTSRWCRSRTPPTATRAIPARSRSRSTRRSRAASASTGDRHVLVRARRARASCSSSSAPFRSGSGWEADSGARFDLSSNALRPLGWTSADAAGLPILPGLVRYDEVAAGEIRHAIRVTFSRDPTRLRPAGHALRLVGTDANAAADGLRLRLKASFDTSHAHRAGARDRRGDAALRADRRRQRIELVLPGRAERGLERRRSRTS